MLHRIIGEDYQDVVVINTRSGSFLSVYSLKAMVQK
jgi:hypothetical protein